MYPKIVLHKGKEVSLLRFHPWVFSGAIKSMEAAIEDGAIVEVTDHQYNTLGIGHYQKGSISVRLLSFEKVEVNAEFWYQKLANALHYRRFLGLAGSEHTNVFRLVFGEGDDLPGLVLDYYNGHIVFQAHSIGMHKSREAICEALIRLFGDTLQGIYDKSAESLPKEYGKTAVNGPLYKEGSHTIATEYGHRFLVNWEKGQKTGFFIDQRENRRLLGEYSKDKLVLNTFSYTGGFSIFSGAAGAQEIHSVDVSAPAIELCNENASLNNLQNHKGFAVDTFDFLKQNHQQYDVIVLDPPAFAKSRDVKHNAVIGYKRLNAMALKHIKPGGVLFTFSCSQVIDKILFYNTIAAAAIEARRNVKVLHYLHQPADHPVKPFFPEGEYLKGMVLFVE